jgi:outer membrane protein OmpA-like peptidoglycan-associated protein
MQLRSTLLAATILAVPAATSAQPVTGLYVGAGLGVNITQKENVKAFDLPALLPGVPLASGGQLNGSTGFAGVVSVGWGFGNGLRAEIEGNYRSNHSSNFSGLGANVGGGTKEQKYGGMVNVLYDFNGLSPWIVPYLGAGVGYEAINEDLNAYNLTAVAASGLLASGVAANAAFAPGSLRASGQNTQGSFAYQAIVGAALPLPQIVPGLAATVEYRFLGTTGNRTYHGIASASAVSAATGAPLGTVATPASVTLGPSYNHSVLIGLRYNFGVAPPPPPPPAPPPVAAPARSYLVFFDWDKATLTDRARQIIREAADNSTKVQYTRIEVNGYTDTSGTPRYNMGLSIRRARAVQAELIKDGVPAGAITIQGFGETHLLVPTGPGVREPQNRRVEIIIR